MRKIILTSMLSLFGLAMVSCGNEKTDSTITTSSKTNQKEKTYERIGNDIYFGSYPQTLINDDSLIASLNSNTDSFISYKYYIEDAITDYMYYKDIDTNNDGYYDYRGVYFTQYRPEMISGISDLNWSFQDNNNYLLNNVYWFKYEPIKWDILREDNEDILISSELLLDSQEYYNSINNHNDKEFANNYELSNIRKWLNDDFYNIAFNNKDKENIKTRSLYNGTTPSKYSSNNTEDNIFLLSTSEAKLYYNTDELRQAIGTDYAKCQGLVVNTSIVNTGFSTWMLRTPSANTDYSVSTIITDGTVDGNGSNVHKTTCGIRPALLLYV